ncbi:MAG TPA: 2,3-bisphosphoglycerate-independent phosphoglycerate mutase, partial [Deltaproteobacteria bacterium]|nr:2,3-bisphosphoglycerate-independent phosphoglycerate mutase [Deltaproteobacteria bacterium]
SEVGHMNIGAGRIVKQDLVRINEDISTNSLYNNVNLQSVFNNVKSNNSTLHLMGLMSDGGVHSHIDHFKYILQSAKQYGVENVAIHAFTDGRDTPPQSGIHYLQELEEYTESVNIGYISTVCGRYYAMDRDKRWDRNEKAYQLLLNGIGNKYSSIEDLFSQSYADGISDEFILPSIIDKSLHIQENDAILAMNFRSDRMRQISDAITNPDFIEYETASYQPRYVSMTKYQESFNFPTLYEPVKLSKIFPEILSINNINQLRIAETEKYAHVTYFFNGGDEKLFEGEERILIPSPKVSTYDLQPEMSAGDVTSKVIEAIQSDKFGAIILNFANADMVGHTGDFQAAVHAVEAADAALGKIVRAIEAVNGLLVVTADHGNADQMLITNKSGTLEMSTKHSLNPVPFLIYDPLYGGEYQLKPFGEDYDNNLSHVAATNFVLLGQAIPDDLAPALFAE